MKYRDKLLHYQLIIFVLVLMMMVYGYIEFTKVRVYVRSCSNSQIQFQDRYFPAAKVRGCPPNDDRYMRLIHTHIPDASTFIDIGSNKGYTSVRFFHLWKPTLNLTPASWKKKSGVECGACNDCLEDTTAIVTNPCDNPDLNFKTSNPNLQHGLLSNGINLCAAIQNEMQVMAFDGNEDLVVKMDYNIKNWNIGKNKWTVDHAAFTGMCTPGETLRFNPAGEQGSISSSGSMTAPCKTVTDVFNERKLNHVDILKIDTEGHDGNVILGARSPLYTGKITVVMFEYHVHWPEGKLDEVMSLFDQSGYVCYREGKNFLLRWTGCMSDTVSEPSWSNVYCINGRISDGLSIINVFDKHSIAFKYPA